MMETKKIAFIGFWNNFEPSKSIFFKILQKHYNIIICKKEKADYIFFSCFGSENHNCVPEHAVKIFYTGENRTPDFNVCDYAIGFERMTFGDRYIRFPLYFLYDECKMMEQKHLNIEPNFLLKQKRDFCSFTISNEKCLERIEMYKALCKYKKVDSGGRYLNNIGSPVKDKLQFDMSHKFSIVFENCSYDGYCTEKLIQAYAAKTVPIYWGDPQSSTVFNSQSYINVHNFRTFEDVVDEVRRIDSDDSLYLKMLRTPALVSVENSYDTKSKELESFLTNIFNQNIKVAQRRTPDALETQRIQKVAILYRNLPFHKKLFAYIQRHLRKKSQL